MHSFKLRDAKGFIVKNLTCDRNVCNVSDGDQPGYVPERTLLVLDVI